MSAINEVCSCGAEYEIEDTSGWTTAAINEALQHWRDGHKHEMPAKPKQDETRPPYRAAIGTIQTTGFESPRQRGRMGVVT